jgi:hypothetical protein
MQQLGGVANFKFEASAALRGRELGVIVTGTAVEGAVVLDEGRRFSRCEPSYTPACGQAPWETLAYSAANEFRRPWRTTVAQRTKSGRALRGEFKKKTALTKWSNLLNN